MSNHGDANAIQLYSAHRHHGRGSRDSRTDEVQGLPGFFYRKQIGLIHPTRVISLQKHIEEFAHKLCAKFFFIINILLPTCANQCQFFSTMKVFINFEGHYIELNF